MVKKIIGREKEGNKLLKIHRSAKSVTGGQGLFIHLSLSIFYALISFEEIIPNDYTNDYLSSTVSFSKLM